MSYPMDLEDYTPDQLRAEVYRREQLTREGKCWYCGIYLHAHTCKHSEAARAKPRQGSLQEIPDA